jgi:hypothetical protein
VKCPTETGGARQRCAKCVKPDSAMAEPEISGHKDAVARVTGPDSIRKVPGPNTKAAILLHYVAASLLLPRVRSTAPNSLPAD